ncbi:hypothetical protein AAC03nite_24690 [Alicyclobacillus acidoterrestris]|nr:hypothetical protein AAC03nite_24690 [Alicyclobacillus acidoterrestris]
MYSRGIKLLARWMTAPSFVAFFFGLIGFWIAFNSFSPWKFDAPPFMALNLLMSALAGVQATVVAVAEREKEVKEQQRDEHMLHLLEAVSSLLAAQIDKQKGGDESGKTETGPSDGRDQSPMGDAS